MTRNVEFLTDAADYGDAPSFIATGIRRVSLISPNIVRVTFARADSRHDGVEEQRVSGHVDFDVSQLDAILALIRDGLTALVEQPGDTSMRSSAAAH
jgi:hypothetical protein